MSLDPVTDPSIDPCVALLLATDLSIDEVLMLCRCDVCLPGLLVVRPRAGGKRIVRLTAEARQVLDRLTAHVCDPETPVITEVLGRMPTRDAVLRAVADHLEIFRSMRLSPKVRVAIQRLVQLFRQNFLAA